ncbi:MAG: hypothetical protein HY918_05515 [Candidatus Doudnabacteria bacterium]|nr:hypothetical protein [Candidatus Doudnabacteria bacterium]
MVVNRESGILSGLKDELSEASRKSREELRSKKQNIVGERMQELVEAQKNMNALLVKIYEKVCGNTGSNSSEILMELAKEQKDNVAALGPGASIALENALLEYSKLHDKVGFYYRQYEQKPEELFEKCFGKKPEGKVQLILGPMTICFRCFNEQDYIFAYTNYKHEDTSINDVEKAKKSQGAAFPTCKVSDLSNCVIIEKASNNFGFVDKIKQNKIEIKKGSKTRVEFSDLNLNGTVFWYVEGEIMYQLTFQTKKGRVSGVNLYDPKNDNFIFLDKQIDSSPDERIVFPAEKYRETEYLDIEFDDRGFSIVDHSRKKQLLNYEVLSGRKIVVKDESLSKRVRRHEEQHQFNKLFVPKEHSEIPPSLIKSLSKTALINMDRAEAQRAKVKIIEALVRHYRRMYVDFRARDEIIAYYRDGSDIKAIEDLLKNSSLYDYKSADITLESGKKIPIQQWLENLLKNDLGAGRLARYTEYSKDKKDFAKRSSLNFYAGHLFFEREIKDSLQSIFVSDYNRSIDEWLEQIKNLEKLGYGRQQIVAFCNMLPARAWKSFVLRLSRHGQKAKKEQVA